MSTTGPVSKTLTIYIDTASAQRAQATLQSSIDKSTQKIQKLKKEGKDATAEIEELGKMKDKFEEMGRIIDGKAAPSIKMMRKHVQDLKRELESMSKDNPRYAETFDKYKKAAANLGELEKQIRSVGGAMKDVASGSGLFGAIFGGNLAANALQQGLSKMKEFVSESSRLAMEAEGIGRAFQRLNRPGLLDELRKATKGTVSDMELMRNAINFNNFGLPVEKLATALDFARKRAADTGQEVDFLVNSIVIGIGRQSPLILDNLGINAKRIASEFQRTGNFADAAFKIIQEEVGKTGEDLQRFADVQSRINVMIENQQAKLGSWYNGYKGFLLSLLQDLPTLQQGLAPNTEIYIEMQRQARHAQEQIEQINKNANILFNTNFKQFTDEFTSTDFKGRDKVKQQALAMYNYLSSNAKTFYKNDAASLQFYLTSLKTAYDQATTKFKATPIDLNKLSTKDIKGMNKEQLTALGEQIDQSTNSMTSGDKASIQRNIKLKDAMQKQLDIISGAQQKQAESEYKNNQKAQEAKFKQLQEHLEKNETLVNTMAAKSFGDQKSIDDAELQAVRDKYKEWFGIALGHAVETAQLTEQQQRELDALLVEQAKKDAERFNQQREKEKQQQLQAYNDEKEQLKTALDNKNKETIAAAERRFLKAKAFSSEELDAEEALINAKFEVEKQQFKSGSEQLLLLEQQRNEAIENARKAHVQRLADMTMQAVQGIANVYSSFINLQNQQGAAALERERAENDKKKESYKKMLEAKSITQQQYDKMAQDADAAFRAKENAEKRKEFNRNKSVQYITAGIDAAKSITGIWAQFGANPIIAGILTAISVAATGVQIASIAKQRYPEYGKGGMTDGPSHSEGGIDMINSRTGQKVGELEGREAVLSRNTVKNNPEIVAALLNTSMNHNGAAIRWQTQRQAQLNSQMLQERMNFARMYGNGGTVPSAKQDGLVWDDDMRDTLKEFNANLKRGVKAYIVYQDWDKANNTVNELKAASGINTA
jgi:hypothetical protein